MKTLAIFPVVLIKRAMRLDGTHLPFNDVLGYRVAKRCKAAVMSSFGDYSKVHCGSLPLVGSVGIEADSRVFRIRDYAYIANNGSLVFPA